MKVTHQDLTSQDLMNLKLINYVLVCANLYSIFNNIIKKVTTIYCSRTHKYHIPADCVIIAAHFRLQQLACIHLALLMSEFCKLLTP